MMRRGLAIVGLWLVACHTDASPTPQLGTTPPSASALPPVERAPKSEPARALPPRDRPVSSPAIREAHATAQRIVLGDTPLPVELAPADADVHGRFTPLFEPPGTTPLASFYDALAKLEAGKREKVRVLVYG